MFLMELPKLKKRTQELEEVGVLPGGVWKKLHWDLTAFLVLREKWEWGKDPGKSNQITKDMENGFFEKKLTMMELFYL